MSNLINLERCDKFVNGYLARHAKRILFHRPPTESELGAISSLFDLLLHLVMSFGRPDPECSCFYHDPIPSASGHVDWSSHDDEFFSPQTDHGVSASIQDLLL